MKKNRGRLLKNIVNISILLYLNTWGYLWMYTDMGYDIQKLINFTISIFLMAVIIFSLGGFIYCIIKDFKARHVKMCIKICLLTAVAYPGLLGFYVGMLKDHNINIEYICIVFIILYCVKHIYKNRNVFSKDNITSIFNFIRNFIRQLIEVLKQ